MNYASLTLMTVAAAWLAGCATTGTSTSLPAGTIQKGTLANQKLVQDAWLGVSGKAGTLGCRRIDFYEQYAVALPRGNPGSRVWQERWIITCSGKTHPISIAFSEAGLGAANYSIK